MRTFGALLLKEDGRSELKKYWELRYGPKRPISIIRKATVNGRTGMTYLR